VIKYLIKRDKRQLRGSLLRGGSRSSMPIKIYFDEWGNSLPGATWYQWIQQRIDRRAEFLKGYVELGELEFIEDETPQEKSADAESE